MDKKRWHKMSLAGQMGNLGSAVHRALHLKHENSKTVKESVNCALELFDLTIEGTKRKNVKWEIAKMRAVFCDYFFDLGNFKVSRKSIEDYFVPFGILANKQRMEKINEN